jgi:hypothetical protein
MKNHALICALIWIVSSVCSDADVQLTEHTVMHFASTSEGRKILTTKDDFIHGLSPFDRAARMKVDRPVSEDEFLTFVEASVADWTKEEMQTVQAPVDKIRPLLRDWSLPFPTTVELIKTTGVEEGNTAYTRGTAIILPKAELGKGQKKLEELICHELFHILSRQNPGLREQLYGTIGFNRCDEIEFPRELASRKLTNPDAPRNDYFIRLTIAGQPCLAMPVLLSTAEVYNVQRGGEFFQYLNFQFLVVERGSGPLRLKVVYENSVPKVIGPQDVSGFFEQIGRNTDYIIHPDEILANNFLLLILGEKKAPSPEILLKMKEVLGRKRTQA